MSAPNAGEVNTSLTGKETLSLDSNEVEESSGAAASTRFLGTSEEVARQIRAAIDPQRSSLKSFAISR